MRTGNGICYCCLRVRTVLFTQTITVGNGFGLFINGYVLFIAGRYCLRDPEPLPEHCATVSVREAGGTNLYIYIYIYICIYICIYIYIYN
jgi:hypothetical protein